MYHVELLPSGSSHVTPGWTYVADRGFDPAKAAITPAIGRKRGIRDPGRADLSSRQNNAIVRHLAELDRENHRDVLIPIPAKQKDASGRGTRGKVTSNVRRILQSQKTFRNYLDDEEAALAQAAAQAPAQRPAANRVTKPLPPSSLRRSATPKPGTKQQQQKRSISARTSMPNVSAEQTPSREPPQEQQLEGEEQKTTLQKEGLIKTEHDDDPLLRSYIPSAPSERIMQALLAEPPLTYNASRAGPPIMPKAPRHFCCMCGYWGKIRCKNCHLRTCGLDCYKLHEDSRCGAFF
ncbi:hypothetical protein BDV59DRAFT_200357 [Aspergillus ambiguus]|uniref:putative HIT finger domain protein n=1 Tax=Aspergillus ambiguus TaxID=176160 RepID=UPI003CCD2D0B